MEQPNVVDAVAHHRGTLQAHAEGKPLPLAPAVARRDEHVLVHHTRSHEFNPTGLFAHDTPFLATGQARHIHLEARLGKREVAGPEPELDLLTEQPPKKLLHHAAKIRHRHASIHQQALDLVELRLVGRIGCLIPEHAARDDNPEWRGMLLHVPHLRGRRVGTQEQPFVRFEL